MFSAHTWIHTAILSVCDQVVCPNTSTSNRKGFFQLREVWIFMKTFRFRYCLNNSVICLFLACEVCPRKKIVAKNSGFLCHSEWAVLNSTTAMSNRNRFLSQTCHYLNQGRTLDDTLMKATGPHAARRPRVGHSCSSSSQCIAMVVSDLERPWMFSGFCFIWLCGKVES